MNHLTLGPRRLTDGCWLQRRCARPDHRQRYERLTTPTGRSHFAGQRTSVRFAGRRMFVYSVSATVLCLFNSRREPVQQQQHRRSSTDCIGLSSADHLSTIRNGGGKIRRGREQFLELPQIRFQYTAIELLSALRRRPAAVAGPVSWKSAGDDGQFPVTGFGNCLFEAYMGACVRACAHWPTTVDVRPCNERVRRSNQRPEEITAYDGCSSESSG
jgi:hypothetical protein